MKWPAYIKLHTQTIHYYRVDLDEFFNEFCPKNYNSFQRLSKKNYDFLDFLRDFNFRIIRIW